MWVIISHRATVGPGLSLLKTIWSEFFWPQYKTRWFGHSRKVRFIDCALDESIAFDPGPIRTYLSFVHLWFKTRGYLYSRFGKDHLPELREFLVQMKKMYTEAGWVYKRVQSTTVRPPKVRDPYFYVIYIFDPHYHCLPSLHVIVVCLNYFYCEAVEGEGLEVEKQHAYRQAVRITESVLEVKQHSVNCIAASLYLLSKCFPQFGAQKVQQFIGELFAHRRDGNFSAIREHIFKLYLNFFSRSENAADYKMVLVDFLKNDMAKQ